jgi:molybdopterin/thiamine biosynthesis adenylyltransferase
MAMKFKHVFVVGAGGIGSHLLEPLVRLLAYHENGTKNVTIVDGDVYEEKNQVRQLFNAEFVGRNKAEVLAEQMAQAVHPIQHVPEYVNKDKFLDLLTREVDLEDPVMVVTAVDNHASRKAIIEALDEGEFPNFVFLSGGNGYSNGQVMTYAKVQGEPGTVHPFEKYDDLKYPADHIPGDPGCQVEAVSTPQLITANASAALGLLWTVQSMLDDGEWFEELHFDTVKMKLVSQGNPICFPRLDAISEDNEQESNVTPAAAATDEAEASDVDTSEGELVAAEAETE